MQADEFKREGKVLRSALALLAFISAGGTLGWMLLAPDFLVAEVEARTGFPLQVEKLSCNPFGMSVSGQTIEVGNPESFGGGDPMLEISRLNAHLSVAAWGRGDVRIHDLELTIPHATLVVDERGDLNLDAFATRLFARQDGSGQMPFFAERVRLQIDRITFVDNSSVIPRSETLRVLLDVELSDLETPRAVFGPLRELAASVGSLPID